MTAKVRRRHDTTRFTVVGGAKIRPAGRGKGESDMAHRDSAHRSDTRTGDAGHGDSGEHEFTVILTRKHLASIRTDEYLVIRSSGPIVVDAVSPPPFPLRVVG